MNRDLERALLKVANEKGLDNLAEFCACSGVSLLDAYDLVQKNIDKKVESLVEFYKT